MLPFLVLIYHLIIQISQSKHISTKVLLGQLFYSEHQKIAEFNSQKQSTAEFKIKFNQNLDKLLDHHLNDIQDQFEINIAIFDEEHLHQIQDIATCTQKMYKAQTVKRTKIKMNGKQSTFKIKVQMDKPQQLYYFIFECEEAFYNVLSIQKTQSSNMLSNFVSNSNFQTLSYTSLEVDMVLIQSDDSHLDYNEYYCFHIVLTFLILYLIQVKMSMNELRKSANKDFQGDQAMMFILCAASMHVFSCVQYLLHYVVYNYLGYSFFYFNYACQGAATFSQYIINCTILLLSTGWTIKYTDIDKKNEYFYIVFSVLGLFKILLVIMDRVLDPEYYKYNDYIHSSGYTLAALRVIMYLYFLFNIFRNLIIEPSLQIKKFTAQLLLIGSIFYLQIIPVFFIKVLLNQQNWLIGTIIINLGVDLFCLLILKHILCNANSTYYKISYKNQDLLPNHVDKMN